MINRITGVRAATTLTDLGFASIAAGVIACRRRRRPAVGTDAGRWSVAKRMKRLRRRVRQWPRGTRRCRDGAWWSCASPRTSSACWTGRRRRSITASPDETQSAAMVSAARGVDFRRPDSPAAACAQRCRAGVGLELHSTLLVVRCEKPVVLRAGRVCPTGMRACRGCLTALDGDATTTITDALAAQGQLVVPVHAASGAPSPRASLLPSKLRAAARRAGRRSAARGRSGRRRSRSAFAFDAAGMALLRALAVLATHPDHMARH